MIATAPSAALPVTISRFSCLPKAGVEEQITVTWPEWLRYLAAEPADDFAGQMQHPGWSPVAYEPRRREKANVRRIYGLVLDYDKGGSWDRVHALWSGRQGLIYTTKSHSAAGDRLRVVLPLSRHVSNDEYERIWRWAARRCDEAGSPADPQCKDSSRFWYLPTRPMGDWRSELLEGLPLDADAVLAEPEPQAPRLRAITTPPAFDRNYRSERARRYLAKIPGAISGSSGHTATFNAVAAVMFGFDLDPDTTYDLIASEYNPRCDPPWSERELLHKIQSVAKQCQRERGYLLTERQPVRTIQQAATRAPEAPAEISVDWRTELQTKKDGSARRGCENVRVFVRHHPDYRGRWSLNTMTSGVYVNDVPMADTLVHDVRAHIDRILGFSPGREDVEAAILMAASDRQFHPIQQYLRSIDWDGVPRLSAMARDYFGTDHALYALFVRKWMISAVARALNPGCKVDTALMLYGEQGFFKSTFFAILGGDWHADSPIDIANKDSFQQIHAAWIYEFAELENVVTGRAESRLKAWLTSTHDMYRAPYARSVTRKARSCVICGTTNRKQFLTDDTGSRRFLIVPIQQTIPRDLLVECRDQLWAEAMAAYESGEPWWLDRDAEIQREDLNAEYHDEDSWHDAVAAYLDGRDQVTVGDVLEHALGVEIARQGRWEQVRVGRILTAMKWARRRENNGSRRWFYEKPIQQGRLL
jgi:hypothetical protein